MKCELQPSAKALLQVKWKREYLKLMLVRLLKAVRPYGQKKDPVIFLFVCVCVSVYVAFTSGWEGGTESDPVPYSYVIILNTKDCVLIFRLNWFFACIFSSLAVPVQCRKWKNLISSTL